MNQLTVLPLQLAGLQRVRPNPYTWPEIEARIATAIDNWQRRSNSLVIFLSLHAYALMIQYAGRIVQDYNPLKQAYFVSTILGFPVYVPDCEAELGQLDQVPDGHSYFTIEGMTVDGKGFR